LIEKSVSLKKNIKRELETLGWIYQRRATFMANFPFRRKYMIFDFAFIKDGAQDIHRVKVTMDDKGASGYKLMKWLARYEI